MPEGRQNKATKKTLSIVASNKPIWVSSLLDQTSLLLFDEEQQRGASRFFPRGTVAVGEKTAISFRRNRCDARLRLSAGTSVRGIKRNAGRGGARRVRVQKPQVTAR